MKLIHLKLLLGVGLSCLLLDTSAQFLSDPDRERKEDPLGSQMGIDRPIKERDSFQNENIRPTEEDRNFESTPMGSGLESDPAYVDTNRDKDEEYRLRKRGHDLSKEDQSYDEQQIDLHENQKDNIKPPRRNLVDANKANREKKIQADMANDLSDDFVDDFEVPQDTTNPQIKSALIPERSSIEDIFFGKFPDRVSKDLKQFGYDVFNQKPGSFTRLKDIPISPDYIVGAGDSFTLNVWGSSNFTKLIQVRRDGTIFIPKVGAMQVAGQTFKQMSSAIEKKLSHLVSGVRVNLSFENIRSIDVYVVGEVVRPGTYTIASTATAINALFYAGGAKKNGSLRQVKVIRNNKEVGSVDLYDFLISGSNTGLRLQSQDVIHVPVVGKVVAVAGNVKRPAIYEITDTTTIFDVIELAGGLTFAGEVGRVSLDRVRENKERVTKDYKIPDNYKKLSRKDALKTELGTLVTDGDLIKIFPVLPEVRKTVFLRGHVKRPGPYEFKKGMKVADVVRSFDQLLPQPYTEFVQIIRIVPPKDEKKSIFVNLERAMEGDEANNLALEDRDTIVVFSKDRLNLHEKVSISGKVNKPGSFYFFEGMRLKDLIFMAGNLTQDAFLPSAEIARYSITESGLQYERLPINLELLIKGDEANNPELKPKDKVLIKGLPDWELNNFITLKGEVKYPGKYSFSPHERLSSVLQRAGGFTDKAFLPGAFFTRKSVQELQRKSLREQISQLETATLQESIRPSQALGGQDATNFQEAVTARKALLKKLQSAEVTGRMVIYLKPLKQFINDKYDINLEADDTLTIPSIPSTVNIMGEVYNQTSIVFVPGKSVEYYLGLTGGTTTNADNESIFLIRADGTVVSRRQNRGFLLRNFYQTEVERGDTILVPKDISQFSWLSATKDITDIIFKIASTTGITITALK